MVVNADQESQYSRPRVLKTNGWLYLLILLVITGIYTGFRGGGEGGYIGLYKRRMYIDIDWRKRLLVAGGDCFSFFFFEPLLGGDDSQAHNNKRIKVEEDCR
jgi:hypothetical protein